jgi:hypothetical protein
MPLVPSGESHHAGARVPTFAACSAAMTLAPSGESHHASADVIDASNDIHGTAPRSALGIFPQWESIYCR